MDIQIEKIKSYIENKELDNALKLADDTLKENHENIELLLLKGDILFRQLKNGKALNIYNKILKLDKNNSVAKSKFEMISNILKYDALDIFASTNLNNDPWLD